MGTALRRSPSRRRYSRPPWPIAGVIHRSSRAVSPVEFEHDSGPRPLQQRFAPCAATDLSAREERD